MSANSETQMIGRRQRSRVSRVRKVVLAIAFTLFCVGVVIAGGLGDACSVGYEAIAAVCPLGALEGFFGSWAFVPRMAIGLALALVVVIVAGRAFCSWICPVPLFRDSCAQRSSGIASRQSRRLRPRNRWGDGRRRARVAPAAAATFARVLETQEETRLSRRLHGPARA